MNNIEYIKNWFMSHNQFLKEESYREEKLDILVFYAIAFEKMANLEGKDEIVVDNGNIHCVSGPVIIREEADKILKILNVKYGYLNIEVLKRTAGYLYIQLSGIEGIVEDKELRENMEDIFAKAMRYYQNYNFDKYVYKVNEKVFFSVNPLSEREQMELTGIRDRDQTLYEISHNEDGMMSIY